MLFLEFSHVHVCSEQLRGSEKYWDECIGGEDGQHLAADHETLVVTPTHSERSPVISLASFSPVASIALLSLPWLAISTAASSSYLTGKTMKLLKDNGLTIVLVLLSIATIGGMMLTGWTVYNHELAEHGAAQIGLSAYATSGHFLSSLFENWESEFMQMSAYVMLTAFLFQRGSAESKDPDGPSVVDEDPSAKADDIDAPWPVRAGGWARSVYSYSLGIALASLFVLTLVLHLRYSAEAENAQAMIHGQPTTSMWDHTGSAQFWFESLQNWQSEFLSTAVIVVLSIFLRFKGSPESKPVAAPHIQTGD